MYRLYVVNPSEDVLIESGDLEKVFVELQLSIRTAMVTKMKKTYKIKSESGKLIFVGNTVEY